jgi:hypothetical protein
MADWYPAFSLTRIPGRHAYWRGLLRPFRTRTELFEVVVQYGGRPHHVPVAWVVDPEVSRRTHPAHPHLNANGSLCPFFVPDETYDPRRDDISKLLDLVGDWLRKHIHLQVMGWWPGDEAPHSPSEVLRELETFDAPVCVCGSGRAFRVCCRFRYQEAARQEQARRARGDRQLDPNVLQIILDELRRQFGPQGVAAMLPHVGPPACPLRASAPLPNSPQLALASPGASTAVADQPPRSRVTRPSPAR